MTSLHYSLIHLALELSYAVAAPFGFPSLHRTIRQKIRQAAWILWVPCCKPKAASSCWIPVEDLQAFLNTLPGPPLTKTDIEQRLRSIWEESYTGYPKDNLKDECLSLYLAEKAQGIEMRAIIGALQEHLEREEERLRSEQQAQYRQ